ncbi:uncharacterized protein LOC131176407 [Hevea brasiliensis]|uniref:uncharacterized protein LOC131176407 n=1 Tax=Hevea brasiliensis TaxID=3981 RepID=UPI0025CEA2D7|nr:uncharacterized protein LOC131176407 [Hevea brasiliensis]
MATSRYEQDRQGGKRRYVRCREASIISHLMFTDDCILFMRAKPEEASCISSVLQRYQQFSGQKLGLPDVVGRSKKAVFSILKERMWKRLQGWKCKFLSHADKDLFKTIAKAIPTYVMQCFRLPIGLSEELKSIISQFWWVKEFEKENASLQVG